MRLDEFQSSILKSIKHLPSTVKSAGSLAGYYTAAGRSAVVAEPAGKAAAGEREQN